MPVMTMVQSLNLALDQSMAADGDVLCMGEDIAVNGAGAESTGAGVVVIIRDRAVADRDVFGHSLFGPKACHADAVVTGADVAV